MTDIGIRPTMQRLVVVVLALAVLAPAVAAQSSSSFTGKWEGTFKMQRPDGTEKDPRPVVFELTQKGNSLTGTAGPGGQQWKLEKGAVADGKPHVRSTAARRARCSSSTWPSSRGACRAT